MDIGLQVADDCLQQFQAMKMEKKHRYIIFHTKNNKTIEIEKIGARDETYQQFVDSLPQNDARFCVFDYDKKFDDGRVTSKIIYFFWCPDTAPVKVKMVSATTNSFFQNKIQGFAINLQCNDLGSFDTEELEKKIH
ncbi:cofilin/tropomyosin-type actin-binding protein (macronuclear) [Tetrahymena thermophila SB210]|uniref:Cofilin/tropomyosin-type actin-binding protein n=2 Tax=Tetrahymena thermophila TaxID=5911 RepID=Q23W16_TETTS|nr:cofilin/tropomyosin-type actin-binding protein [Tetrahymena thermophila SB210]EAS00689.1 cofilin/tropomyosin-type actin-binding protein [Tetrahymena thermophila SB210]BAH84775.1 Adf73p protein [Tetrahymena thermophila]|eukprot:XP_001020934.1 cofilin/tropomyosin-type actin-binding protein [Tetrahymena thermophila SB210]